jgi:hypothetical protein
MKTIKNNLKNKEYAFAIVKIVNGYLLLLAFKESTFHKIYFKTKKEINIFLKNKKEK